MSTLKKTFILNNNITKNFNGMGVLNLTQEHNGVYGTFKAYNLNNYQNLVLGLAQNNKQILKQNINLINNNTYNFKLNNINLDLPISCVLVTESANDVVPLIWANDKNNLKDDIIENFATLKTQSIVNSKPTAQKAEMPKEKIIENKIDLNEMFDISDGNEIEELINNELNQEEFLTNDHIELDNLKTLSSVSHKNPIDEELKNFDFTEETFYESMSEQIEDLFNKYPSEPKLETLIPNSKWVKIDYENDGNYYVLGLIYEDIDLKYICYGVPGKYSDNPPHNLDSYSQWLPLDPDNLEEGYWVMYQNAITGESVKIDAV